jgi:hypothetical protein
VSEYQSKAKAKCIDCEWNLKNLWYLKISAVSYNVLYNKMHEAQESFMIDKVM